MWRMINGLSVLLSAAISIGCSQAGGSANSVAPVLQRVADNNISSLYKSQNCESISRGGFILVADSVGLQDLLAPLGASAEAAVAQIDFNRHNVLVVDFGAQPTAAFTISLASGSVETDGENAVVRVNIPEGKARKKQAQVVSHPCELFLLPITGRNTLEIRSQYNDVLTRFAVL